MADQTIRYLREELRQTELWASVAEAGLILAEHEIRVARDRLAAARLEVQLAEEMKRGEA